MSAQDRLGLFTCCLIGAATPIALCMKLKNTGGGDRKIRHTRDKRFRTLEMFILTLVAAVRGHSLFAGPIFPDEFHEVNIYTAVFMAVLNVSALKASVEDRTGLNIRRVLIKIEYLLE